MFAIEWIVEKVRSSQYYFSKHGDAERQSDNLTIQEVEEALIEGRILEHYPDTGRGESCLVVGFTKGGETSSHRMWGTWREVVNRDSTYPDSAEIQEPIRARIA
jgi:hypothetical protein